MENQNLDVAALQSRLSQLRERAAVAARKSERKRKIFLVAGVAMVLLCAVCLGRLSSLARALDADALTEIGRSQVERHLPTSRVSIQEHLKQEAPRLITDVLSNCLDLLPAVRKRLIEELLSGLDGVTAKYEADFCQQMVEAIRATKENLDRDIPGASETQKIEVVTDHLSKDFVKSFRDILDAIYPSYVAEVSRVNDSLKQLSKSDKSKLTERQRTEREIIETFLRLLELERKKSL